MRLIDLTSEETPRIPRPSAGPEPVEEVRAIIEKVRREGDAALIDLTEKFDGVRLDGLRVDPAELEAAASSAPKELIEALEEAERRIRAFAQNQLIMPWRREVGGGTVGEIVHPVARAGIYVPGGRASYPSTVLMCAVPASVAGVGTIALAVPPDRGGAVAPATLAAAQVAGVDEVYRVGGAQAIAALAYGTETVPAADVVAGPGNIYVALAKREVAGTVAIDSVAGPSEIAVIADGTADPRLVAADLLAQAEHGPGGLFALITPERDLISAVERELESALVPLGSSGELGGWLEAGAVAAVVRDLDQAVDALNLLAPEHAELLCDGAETLVDGVRNTGAVFVGRYSPVSLGDYLAGSNHVLPTGGAAARQSGLRASHFQRTGAVVWYERKALHDSAGHVRALAEAEGLPLHARALDIRFEEQ